MSAGRFCYVLVDQAGAVEQAGVTVADTAPAIRAAVPPGLSLVELTQEGYDAVMAAGGRVRIRDGAVEGIPAPVDLPRLRAEAGAAIDAAAERARQPFVAQGAGQAAEYAATLEEAHRIVAGQLADAGSRWIAAEVAARRAVSAGDTATVLGVALEVLAKDEAWQAAGVEIRRLRREAKLRVAAAVTAEAIAAASTGIPWPTTG